MPKKKNTGTGQDKPANASAEQEPVIAEDAKVDDTTSNPKLSQQPASKVTEAVPEEQKVDPELIQTAETTGA